MGPLTCGVYYIKNTVNGKLYVGSSVNMENRWRRHRSDLRWERHPNPKLSQAWKHYGESAFEFGVLEISTPDRQDLTDREEYFRLALDATYNCRPATVNGKPVCSAMRRQSLTAEHRARISASLTGRHLSPEARAKIGEASRQRRHSEKTKATLAECRRGRRHSEETKAKIRSGNLGRSKNQGRFDRTVYCFGHADGHGFIGTRQDLIRWADLSAGMVSEVIRGKRPAVKGWSLKRQDFVGETPAFL